MYPLLKKILDPPLTTVRLTGEYLLNLDEAVDHDDDDDDDGDDDDDEGDDNN